MARVEGRVWVFGDHVDTDQMAPLAAMDLPAADRRRMLFPNHRDFVDGVTPGDIVVAGRNWGCGSSREHAPHNLRELGVAAVVAESFARIYFRNSVAVGFPALECPGITAIVSPGERLGVDLAAGTATLDDGRVVSGRGYTPLMLEIMASGGLLEHLARTARPSGQPVAAPTRHTG